MKFFCRPCGEIVDRPWPKPGEPRYACDACGTALTAPPKERKPLERKSKPKPRGPISEASEAQRAKVAGMACAACGKSADDYRSIDPAHLASRAHGGCDAPECAIPLCRTKFGDGGCHRRFDEGDLDLLSQVISETWPTYRREVQHALEHMRPVQLLERLGNARTQWTEAAA